MKLTNMDFLLLFLVASLASCLTRTTAGAPFHVGIKDISTSEPVSLDLTGLNLEGENTTESERSLSDSTARVDPLKHLKKYRGGYNISNKHYWSSTAFTGKYGYGIGIAWLFSGLGYALFLLAASFCFNKRRTSKRPICSRKCYFWSLIFALLFTLIAIIASGVALGGTSRFYSRAKTVRNLIIETADEASKTLYNTTAAIRAIQANVGFYDDSGRLNSTTDRLDKEAANIERQARRNRRWVTKGLTILYASTAVLISLNLVAVLALLVCRFLRLPRIIIMLIVLCWVFTALCWIAFGLYFFVEKFAGDTCVALVQYQQDPSSSSLSSILPCDDLRSAQPALLDARAGMHDLLDQINANLSAQTEYPILRQARICNPISGSPDYIYQPQSCPENTIQIGGVPQLLRGFTCSEDGGCSNGQFISVSQFNQVSAYTSSIQGQLDILPGMESLVECQPVQEAITEILSKHCKPVKKYIQMVWAAMLVLSISMMVLILIWMVKDHHDRRSHFSDGSVKPHSATPDMSDSDTSATEAKISSNV